MVYHIISIMLLFLLTQQKSELLYLLAVDCPGFYGVKASGVDAAVA